MIRLLLPRRTLTVERVHPGARLPSKAYAKDAAFDLYATHGGRIPYGGKQFIDIGIKVHLPSGTYAQIETRSGHGAKGLTCLAGVVDEGFRGRWRVLLANVAGEEDFVFKENDRVAQVVIHPFRGDDLLVEGKVLENTHRGAKGFGSSSL